jgi:hypothetical protein
MSVVKSSNLDLSKITFSDVKTDNHGRKMVYVNYQGGKILVQTPKMYVPNGIKRWRKKDAVDNKDDSFELELSFGGEDKEDKNSMEIRDFHTKLEQFDELVKNKIMSHSKEWLGKTKISMESIEEAFYSPTVRLATDKDGNVLDYPSRVRAKLDREREGETDSFTGRFLSNKRYKTPVLMFDHNKELMEMNESNFDTVVPKGSQVVAVLELVYLSISTKVSAKWKLVQAKVFRNQKTITGYAMLDDSDTEVVEEKEDLDTAETTEEVEVEEEVEEDVEDVEDEEEEEVKPVVTKTVKPRAKRGVQA